MKVTKMVKKVHKIINDPQLLIAGLGSKGLLNWIPDKIYLKILFYLRKGIWLDYNNPQTYNEKLQWLKTHQKNYEYSKLVDKYEVRNYVENKIGEKYLNKCLGIWNNFNDINFNELPNKFVLKCTHDSGGLVICKDKGQLDLGEAKKKINTSLRRNYYGWGREYPYKYVKPRIICEELLEDECGEEIRDYRFFCFDGGPKFISVDFFITDKSKTRRNLYDLDWNMMDGEISYPKELNLEVARPRKLEEMIRLSKELSENIPHVRVDYYYVNDKIYFGELTFFHQSGFGKIKPDSFHKKMGDYIKLS